MKMIITEYPRDYNFEKTFNEHFGVIKGDDFLVTIEFKEFAAAYVAERVWNSEKRKEWIDDETLVLSFKASSEPELIGWVLSWGGRAKVIEPALLKGKIKKAIEALSITQSNKVIIKCLFQKWMYGKNIIDGRKGTKKFARQTLE